MNVREKDVVRAKVASWAKSKPKKTGGGWGGTRQKRGCSGQCFTWCLRLRFLCCILLTQQPSNPNKAPYHNFIT